MLQELGFQGELDGIGQASGEGSAGVAVPMLGVNGCSGGQARIHARGDPRVEVEGHASAAGAAAAGTLHGCAGNRSADAQGAVLEGQVKRRVAVDHDAWLAAGQPLGADCESGAGAGTRRAGPGRARRAAIGVGLGRAVVEGVVGARNEEDRVGVGGTGAIVKLQVGPVPGDAIGGQRVAAFEEALARERAALAQFGL